MRHTAKPGGKRRPAAPLPVIDGLAPSRVFLPPGPWSTVLDFLRERYAHLPEGVLEARLKRGDIVDDDGRAQTPDAPYRPQQWLWYYRQADNEAAVPFELPVLHHDAHLVVADKPHFLASTPGGRYVRETALTRLRRRLDLPELTPVHRLDRDTAGVIVFCADPAHRGAYQTLFQRREVRKVYEAIAPLRNDLPLPCVFASRVFSVAGELAMKNCTAAAHNSQTCIELIKALPGGMGHYRLRPLTGRKHQLRVHLSALGIPILNDEIYPRLFPQRPADDFTRPLQLLARSLSFTDPFSGKTLCFHSRRELSGLRSVPPGGYPADATPTA